MANRQLDNLEDFHEDARDRNETGETKRVSGDSNNRTAHRAQGWTDPGTSTLDNNDRQWTDEEDDEL